MSAAAIFAMWAIMMTAMMLPGAAPTIFRHADALRRVLFTFGYLVIWIGFSVAAAVLYSILDSAELLSQSMALRSSISAGIVVIAVGLYQLSPWKQRFLLRCRAPATNGQRPSALSVLVQGLRYGLSCLGCCWALMALLFVAGVMSYVWMVAIALWIIAEKLLPSGARMARFAAVGLIGWGGVILALVPL